MLNLTNAIQAAPITKAAASGDNQGLVMIIGTKPYKVNIHFNKATTEDINDKIFRLIRNEMTTC